MNILVLNGSPKGEQYDFPQGQIDLRLLNLFVPLIRLPFIRKQFVPRITENSVQPFQRVVETA